MVTRTISTRGGLDSSFNDALIREVRRNPIIFDSLHPLYGNSQKKQEIWSEIAATLGEKVDAIKTRWRTLRDRYTKERRRINISGGGSTFSYYEDLTFLDLYITDSRRQPTAPGLMRIKQEIYEQTSDAGDDFQSRTNECTASVFRTDAEELAHTDDAAEVSVSGSERVSPQQPSIGMVSIDGMRMPDAVLIDETAPPRKRFRMASTNPLENVMASINPSENVSLTASSSTENVADALLRSANALQRFVECSAYIPPNRSSAEIHRDADECFADFVCQSLKAIDNESRVHARIAILHALAQFQT